MSQCPPLPRIIPHLRPTAPCPTALLAEIAGELAKIADLVEDKANENALNKAAYHLTSGVEVLSSAGDFLLPSGTRAGLIHRVSGAGCNCEAGKKGRPCWHAAVAEITLLAWERMGEEDDGDAAPPCAPSAGPDSARRDERMAALALDVAEWY